MQLKKQKVLGKNKDTLLNVIRSYVLWGDENKLSVIIQGHDFLVYRVRGINNTRSLNRNFFKLMNRKR